MKIISFEVVGLFGKPNIIQLNFNEDMNILTGRNGAGKTSVMKLMWYILSGNIEHALTEINFVKVTLVTTYYNCTVTKLSRHSCKIDFNMESYSAIFENTIDHDGDIIGRAEDEANSILMDIGSSVFLPTFRRIEGGFSLRPSRGIFGRLTRNKG